jgi:asparagine synthase (glutamine-hydrolysing)
MCGISGAFGLEDLENPRQIVQKMNQLLAHRGPDADGIYEDESVVLGHRRLSIIDLSDAGNQPFYNHDKSVVLVFNGELYNYIELKSQLDYDFKTESDSEVFIAAFLKWGINCLQKFNGMFAFALWDTRSKQLFVGRDRLGIKPLYYYQTDKSFLFSSEIRSLLSSNVIPRKIDQDSLIDYLRYQTVHAPATIVQGVEMLLPGYYIQINDEETTAVKYWDICRDFSRQSAGMDYQQVTTRIRELLKQSMEYRMRADVSFGAFLSGGIDSSAVVGLMSEITSHPVKTFSVTFDEDEFSEAPYSRMIAKRFNTDHTEIRLQSNDFLDLIPSALGAMDHPSGDGPNTYVVSKVTKEAGVTMALSGLGGDELFAGYQIFPRMLKIQDKRWVMSFPKAIRNMGTGLYKKMKPSVSANKIAEVLDQDYLDFEYVYPINRQVMLDKNIALLTGSGKLPQNAVHTMLADQISFGHPGFGLPLLSKVSYAEINSYMQNVLLRDTDQMSMAHALEVRVPFLDHELVEFVMGVNDEMKYPHSPKKLLTDSLTGLLPDEVVNRPKMGFTFPWSVWMKNELKPMCEQAMQSLAHRSYFNEKAVMKLWERFLSDDPKVQWSRVWPLVVLENWLSSLDIE